MKIGICAPSTPFTRDDTDRVVALAAISHPQAELVFADQCFFKAGHFAGLDAERLTAFVEMASDPAFDAIWFARGGYGACRIAADAVAALGPSARDKLFIGYSDAGNMLAALYGAGFDQVTHGPMPADIRRDGGEAAVTRALDWICARERSALEPSLLAGQKYAAFNVVTLGMLLGTRIAPNLSHHVLMIEEVSEHLYAFDRAFFHLSESLRDAKLTGIALGRVSDLKENDREFGHDAEEIARFWCTRTGIEFLGAADIGHDVGNHVVPFGTFPG